MSEPSVTDLRIENLERAVTDIRRAIQSIDNSLRILARLEERHEDTRSSLDRAFAQIEEQEARLRTLENEAPVTRLVRNWIISAVVGVVALVAVALLRLPSPQ